MFKRAATIHQATAAVPQQVATPPAQINPATAPGAAQMRAPTRLSSYKFADMYIWTDPLHPIMARGLQSGERSMGFFGGGLKRVPDEVIPDILKLLEMVNRKWRHSNFLREFVITYDAQAYRCSLIAPPNFSSSSDGEERDTKWCIRQLSMAIPSLNSLGYPDWVVEDIEALRTEQGLVLIAGSFSSGKTTLASSAFNHWVTKSQEFGVALEDPPELPLAKITDDEGIIEQNDLTDKSVQEAIKNSKRWSPRYVFLGEVRTAEVTAEIIGMAIAGPLVICTIHASDVVNAIASFAHYATNMMGEKEAHAKIASSLKQVFHSRIIGGRARLTSGRTTDDNHLIIGKIEKGNWRGLYEEFDRQSINRTNGK